MVKRPYMKFLIAGGVVSSEGGPLLIVGLELLFLIRPLPFISTLMNIMAIGFTVAGGISLIVGLSLLAKGVNERNIWLRNHGRGLTSLDEGEEPWRHPRAPEAEAIERPIARTTIPRRFCAACGSQLPNLPNVKFCPKCGEEIG